MLSAVMRRNYNLMSIQRNQKRTTPSPTLVLSDQQQSGVPRKKQKLLVCSTQSPSAPVQTWPPPSRCILQTTCGHVTPHHQHHASPGNTSDYISVRLAPHSDTSPTLPQSPLLVDGQLASARWWGYLGFWSR